MFTGTVESRSHEGGLLVHFKGSSPALNAIMVNADDGVYVGKVDGVLGSTDRPLAHVAHIDRSLNMDELIGVQLKIRAKVQREQRNDRRGSRDERPQRRFDNDRRGGRDNDRRGGPSTDVDETTTVAVDAMITTVVVDETTSVPGISDNSTTTGHAQNATIPILRSEKPAIDVKHLAPPAEGNNGPMTATTTIEGVVVTTAQVVVSVTTVVAVVTTVPVDVTTTTVEVVVSNVTRSTPTTGRVQNATIPIFPSARRAIDATPPVQEAVEAVANSATTAVDTASRARTVALVTVEMEAVITETKAVDAVDRNATTTIEPIVKREESAQVMHTINRRVTFARPGNLNEKTIER